MSARVPSPCTIRRTTPDDLAALDELFAVGDEHHREALSDRFRISSGPVRSHDLLTDWLSHRTA
ncbi:MAG TPA: hypothetical protein GX702_09005 [Chloroflexi bacterium]|jgi:hypothetical protein|nr:hypothetical protein [Chloroflexota bacterium]